MIRHAMQHASAERTARGGPLIPSAAQRIHTTPVACMCWAKILLTCILPVQRAPQLSSNTQFSLHTCICPSIRSLSLLMRLSPSFQLAYTCTEREESATSMLRAVYVSQRGEYNYNGAIILGLLHVKEKHLRRGGHGVRLAFQRRR